MAAHVVKQPETPGEERKRLRAIVHGRVQGVSFRYYTRERAENLAWWVTCETFGIVRWK